MTDTRNFNLLVSYSQIVVYDGVVEEPFNDWTQRHVAQGFAWRPGSVSFATLEESGVHEVDVVSAAANRDAPSADAVRVIDVPFQVPRDGQIEIASISDSSQEHLTPGLYQLRFENFARIKGNKARIRLSFTPSMAPVFRVVRADGALRPDDNLFITASPA